jgi:universal stress protein E
MRRIRRILVAIKDPSASALPAVTKAAQIAEALGAQLTLFHAVAAPAALANEFAQGQLAVEAPEERDRELQEGALQRIATRLRRRGLRVATIAERDQPPDQAILREAARCDADLVVVEAHPHHRGHGTYLRLTDWELLRRCPQPLLLVKLAAPYRKPRVLVALDPDHTFDKPAVLDAQIVGIGSMVARALRGSLHAVHAYLPIDPADLNNGLQSSTAMHEAQKSATASAERKLARATRAARIPKARRHLSPRHVPDAIEDIAAATGSSLVVLGSVARSGLKHLLIGNTAERVLDHLASDIMLIKPSLPVTARGRSRPTPHARTSAPAERG